MVRFLHINLMFQIIWIALFLLKFIDYLNEYKSITVISIGGLFSLINLLYLMPNNLKLFCLTTNVIFLEINPYFLDTNAQG